MPWAAKSGVWIPAGIIDFLFSSIFRTALVPTKPPIHWVSRFFLKDKTARMWSWPPPTCNVKVKNKWSCPSVPPTSFMAWSGALLHFHLHDTHFMKKMHTKGWWENRKERDHLEGLHSDVTIWYWYCCLYCNMSPVEMGTFAPNCSMFVTCWDCVRVPTYPHTEIGTVSSILQNVTYSDIDLLMCSYCNILSPAEAGTIMSTLYHATCWDWYHYVHFVPCHLLRLVPSCPYCNILSSPVQIDTTTPTGQVKCTAQFNYILTAVLQRIINILATELNAWCEV
jgi:hypothetical protein